MHRSKPTSRALLQFALLVPLSWSVATALSANAQKPAASAHTTQTHTVAMEKFQFQPATLTVDTGDVITWKNSDIYPHTVTDSKGAFDSGNIAQNATWTYTATKPGTYAYICSLHPNMHGTLIVK
jgi:plastocyanin